MGIYLTVCGRGLQALKTSCPFLHALGCRGLGVPDGWVTASDTLAPQEAHGGQASMYSLPVIGKEQDVNNHTRGAEPHRHWPQSPWGRAARGRAVVSPHPSSVFVLQISYHCCPDPFQETRNQHEWLWGMGGSFRRKGEYEVPVGEVRVPSTPSPPAWPPTLLLGCLLCFPQTSLTCS